MKSFLKYISKKKDLLFVGLGLLFLVVRYFRQIFSNWIYGPFVDGSYLLGPVFSYISRSFATGETPYLVGSILSGMPIYNTMHFSIYYPFYFFGLVDWGIGHEAQRMMAINSLLHFVVIFINTYVLARVMKINAFGAFVAGSLILIAANTGKLAVWNHSLAGYAWVPLVAAGLILIFDQPDKYRGPLVLAISALGITAMPAQPLVQAVLIAIPIVIVGFIRTTDRFASLKKIFLGTILSFGISAVGIIPAIIDYAHMLRFVGPGLKTIGYEKIPFEAFFNSNLDAGLWKEFLVCPITLSHGPGHIYIGPLAFLLSLFGIYQIFKSSESKFLKGLYLILTGYGIYFLLSSFGNTYYLATVNKYIPFLNKIREPIRHGSISSITFAITAGYGAVKLLNINFSGQHRLNNALLALGIIITYTCFSYQLDITSNLVYKMGFIAITSTITYLIFIRYSRAKILLLLTLIFMNGLIVSRGAPKGFQKAISSKTPENLASLQILREIKENIKDVNQYRILYYDHTINNNRFSMNSAYFDLRSFGNSFSPLPNPQAHFMGAKTDSNIKYKTLFGAKYHVFNINDNRVTENYTEVFRNDKFKVLANPKAKPRIYANENIKEFSGGLHKFEKTLNQDPDYDRYTYTSPKTKKEILIFLSRTKNKNKTVEFDREIIQDNINIAKYKIKTNKRSIVVFNEFYNKNWQLMINEVQEELVRCNLNQMCFKLKPGISTIELRFRPKLFIFLRYLQIVFYLVLVLLLILTLRTKTL